MELRPYQKRSVEAVLSAWYDVDKTLLVLPTGCHAIGEKVLLSDGTVKKVEDVKATDKLLGADGKPRKILKFHNGVDELYKITPIKGEPFIVTKNHKLTLVRTNEKSRKKYPSDFLSGTLTDVTVDEWISWSKTKKHIHKLIRCSGISEFDNSVNLPIEPYFLGVLLGDGDIKNNISITTQDSEVVQEIDNQCIKHGMSYRIEPAGKANTYILKSGKIGCKGGRLHNELKELGLRGKKANEKSVPAIYKTASMTDRLQVIAGLLDTDGSLTCGGYDFVSASKTLSEDLAFMCRSVGLAAYVKESIKKSQNDFKGIYYRVSISGNCDIIPCRIPYKKAGERKQKKNVLHTGFDVEYIGTGKYIGFTVDEDNRYLMGDFTITHNCGKTVVFSKIAEERAKQGKVLILAHRGELLEQARDKLYKFTGLDADIEKAESYANGSDVVVGSIQTLINGKRLDSFGSEYKTIIIDEAHHVLSDSYQKVLNHFPQAKVLGVTATPDRGDMKNLGRYFDSLAYEYTLPEAIKEGYLCKIKALTIPLNIDLSNIKVSAGDFTAASAGSAIEPYLEQIADEMVNVCMDKKTVVFLPLIETSQKFCELLNERGFRACEVNGNSTDRAEKLKDFEEGRYNALCNSMLLTEGWDCPSVDCVVVLRPTKVRSLYTQMVGRGTRLSPGKDHLLILDFLWHTERHRLCKPAVLISRNEDIEERMNKLAEGKEIDLQELEEKAIKDAREERERALKEELEKQRHKKKKLVDPLQYEMSISGLDLSGYVPSFKWEEKKPTDKQLAGLERLGINPDGIDSAGKASLLLDRLINRAKAGMSTPKQIRLLERYGFKRVGDWTREEATKMISRISARRWMVPRDVDPAVYLPDRLRGAYE